MYAVLKMVKNVPYLGNLCSGTTFENSENSDFYGKFHNRH